MNPQVKKKWLKALRSGEYEQTAGYLCRIGKEYDSFCCLGVLCDLYARRRGSKESWQTRKAPRGILFFEDQGGDPPFSVMDWAGLSEQDTQVLINKNDVENESFDRIADYIDENL